MIDIEGIDKIIAKVEDMADIEDKFTQAVLFIEGIARDKAPKRTGNLKGSIESRVDKQGNMIEGTVYSTAHYAPYIEHGTGLFAVNGDGRKTGWAYEDELTGKTVWTRGSRPYPFLAPALRENKDVILQFLQEGLNK